MRNAPSWAKAGAFADRPPTSVATAAGASNDKRALEIGRARPRSSKASLAPCQFTHGRFSTSHFGVVPDLSLIMAVLVPRLSGLGNLRNLESPQIAED